MSSKNMAIWQFTLVLIPASWAKEHEYDASKLYLGDDGYETEITWKGRQPELGFEETLSEVLPPSTSWNDESLFWGSETEHDIYVGYENQIIDGIHIRLALNKELNEIIIKIVKAAKTLNCVLFFPELGLIAEANEFEIKSAIKNSNASKFVRNPHKFLTEIAERSK